MRRAALLLGLVFIQCGGGDGGSPTAPPTTTTNPPSTGPVVRVTSTNGIVTNLLASTVTFRVNVGGSLGSTQRSLRLCSGNQTQSRDISQFVRILGPATNPSTSPCCVTPTGTNTRAEQITYAIVGGSNTTAFVVDTCDPNGNRRLAISGVDPTINNTVTINFSAISRVDFP